MRASNNNGRHLCQHNFLEELTVAVSKYALQLLTNINQSKWRGHHMKLLQLLMTMCGCEVSGTRSSQSSASFSYFRTSVRSSEDTQRHSLFPVASRIAGARQGGVPAAGGAGCKRPGAHLPTIPTFVDTCRTNSRSIKQRACSGTDSSISIYICS
jgi:hypothetical protein